MQYNDHEPLPATGYRYILIPMDDKTTGYVLLICGIVIMIFATIQLALLVTRVTRPFPTFKFTEVFTATGSVIQQTQQQQANGTTRTINEEISPTNASLSPEVVNEVLNFAVFFFLMAFAVNMGYKISELGVKMIRPTTIKVHPKNIESIVANMPDTTQSPLASQGATPPQGKTVF